MKHISELQFNIEQSPPKTPHKIKHSFQELGIELQKEFKTKAVWPIFYKKQYNEEIIREAFRRYKLGKVKTFTYFMGILKKTK